MNRFLTRLVLSIVIIFILFSTGCTGDEKNTGSHGSNQITVVPTGTSPAIPSAGKNWTLATDKVPFGNRQENAVTVWNDAIWVIGGNKLGGSQGNNDTWYSRDGSLWTRATQNAGFEARYGQSAVIFHDKLWVIGGEVDHVNETGQHFPVTKNDTWYSADDKTWTMASSSAGYPPQRYAKCVVLNDRIWLIGKQLHSPNDFRSDVILWSSADGVHWNQSPIPSSGEYNWLSTVVKDNRIWVLQHESTGGFWNTADGITKTNAKIPPYDGNNYSITADSLAVYNNKFWLFRALENREGDNKMHGELWSSDDGNNWVLITDSIPFAEGTRALNNLHLIPFNKKLWAYMVRGTMVKGTSDSPSNKWIWNTEIWYTIME